MKKSSPGLGQKMLSFTGNQITNYDARLLKGLIWLSVITIKEENE